MQLSINGWPPLATHFACILAGYTICQSSLNQVVELPKVVTIPIKSKNITIKAAQNERVVLRGMLNQKNCDFTLGKILLLQKNPHPVLGANYKDTKNILKLLETKKISSVISYKKRMNILLV